MSAASTLIDRWMAMKSFMKIVLVMMTIFTFANVVYFATGDSPYTWSDMLGLAGIFVGGTAVIFVSDFIFQMFRRSKGF